MGRYALDGTVLPLLQETLSLGELRAGTFRGSTAGRIMGCHQQFSAARHRRAYRFKTTAMPFISLQTRTVMGTSTISLFMHADKLAQKGWIWAFEEAELQALDAFRHLRQVGGKPDLRLVLLGVGDQYDWKDASIFCRSRHWRSHTPFVPPRHEKTRGQKRETPVERLRGELQRRGFPEPVVVRSIPRCELQGRSIRWIEFRRERLFGGGSRGQGIGYGFAIEFAEPVVGHSLLGMPVTLA